MSLCGHCGATRVSDVSVPTTPANPDIRDQYCPHTCPEAR